MSLGALASLFALAGLPQPLGVPIDVRIEFDAPSDCAEVSSFYDRVRARTDRVRLAEAGVEALTLRVRVVRRGAKVHGLLRMTDEHGASTTREFDGASCTEVIDALSLTATLALDPNASAEAPPAVVPPPVEVVTLVATPSHPPPPHIEPSIGFEAGMQGGAAEVISPYLSLGGALFARVTSGVGERASRSLGVSLSHFGNDILLPDHDIATRLTTLTLSACPARVHPNNGFSLEPCALVAGGVLTASSRGVTNPDSAFRSWWSAGALLRAQVHLTAGAALELEAGGAFPLLKRRFILGVPERFLGESPGISAFASLGMSYRF